MTFNTLNSIINDILKLIRSYKVADTEAISKRQVEEWIHQYRAMLIKRDLDKGKFPNPDYIQEINYVQLEPVDVGGDNILPDIALPTEAYVFRTNLTIPNTLDLNHKSGFMAITTPSRHEIQYIPEGRAMWQQYRKYTPNDTIAFLRDGRLYIISNEPLEYITLRGVFEIPPEVARFINPTTNQPFFDYNSKYPIPNEMLPTLKQMILGGELRLENTGESDESNDRAHDPIKQ